jgi:hypothetical protein
MTTGLTWHDLLYATALLSGVLLVLGSALGAGELDADGIEADVDMDVDVDADGILDVLGVGRVPTGVIALLLSLIFGGSGLALGPICRALLGPSVGPNVALLLALLAALFGTIGLARVFARALPRSESYASSRRELIGAVGRVIACSRDGEAIVAVVDAGGAELRLRARIAACARAGSEVVIDGHDADRDLYFAHVDQFSNQKGDDR